MKAMLLAAGLGARMHQQYPDLPKPLIRVGDTTLIEHNVMQLKRSGITEIVVNVSYMRHKIMAVLGDGSKYGVHVQYSIEEDSPLETGGGIKKALPLLGDAPFLALSADIWTQYEFEKLFSQTQSDAHLVLVQNPSYHPNGDFILQDGYVALDQAGEDKFTFSNIAVLQPKLFKNISNTVFPLSEVLKTTIKKGAVTGELYSGVWYNVGTPEELNKLMKTNHQL